MAHSNSGDIAEGKHRMKSMDVPVKGNRQCYNCVYFDNGYCKIRAMIRSPKSFHNCSYHRKSNKKEEVKK